MTQEKKYYWLKLKRDFFKRHDIRIIEEMPNGKDYILFYLKLLLESIDHEGELRFSETIPYNEQMLSVITNTNIDIVRGAMKLFLELNMIEMFSEGTIYMNEVARLIGSESASAERVRRHREKKKELPPAEKEVKPLHSNASVTKSNTEIEIEKDIELEKETDKEKRKSIDYVGIANAYKEICTSLPQIRHLSDARKKTIRARFNADYTFDDFIMLFKKAQASDFLTGKNDRKWTADFDWLIKDANMAKVLDGKYDNKGTPNNAYNYSYGQEGVDYL